jgi:signal transduction histidine kinase
MTHSVTVVPDHRRGFADGFEQGRAPLDFRALQGELHGHFRLVAEGFQGGVAWDRGLLIRLDAPDGSAPAQSPAADAGMANAMAAHELKQPLFTIAMAAKSIELLLGQYRTGIAKSDELQGIEQAVGRIRLQVSRAQAIMDSITGEANRAFQDPPASDVRQAMIRAHEFLKPMLDQHGVVTRLTLPDEVLPVSLSHVAVERPACTDRRPDC